MTEARYINAFGEVLSEKAIGVFVTASLPWRLWITKVDVGFGSHCELTMPRHLRSTVPSQGLVELLGQLTRLLDKGRDDALGVLVLDFCQHHKARMALYQRGDVAVVRPYN